MIFIIFSHFHKMELVSADYYAQGIDYQKQIDRIKLDQQNVCTISVEYNQPERVLSIYFPDKTEPRSVSGTIVLFRPAAARQDQYIPLVIDASHQQKIDLHNLSNGLWRIKISWQKDGFEFYHEEKLIIE